MLPDDEFGLFYEDDEMIVTGSFSRVDDDADTDTVTISFDPIEGTLTIHQVVEIDDGW